MTIDFRMDRAGEELLSGSAVSIRQKSGRNPFKKKDWSPFKKKKSAWVTLPFYLNWASALPQEIFLVRTCMKCNMVFLRVLKSICSRAGGHEWIPVCPLFPWHHKNWWIITNAGRTWHLNYRWNCIIGTYQRNDVVKTTTALLRCPL